MHHESRRLVDHEQVVVFVGDRKRAGLRFDGALVSPRFVVDDDAEDLPRPHDLVGFAANAVECDAVVSSFGAPYCGVADEHGSPKHREHGLAVEGGLDCAGERTRLRRGFGGAHAGLALFSRVDGCGARRALLALPRARLYRASPRRTFPAQPAPLAPRATQAAARVCVRPCACSGRCGNALPNAGRSLRQWSVEGGRP